MLVRHASQNPVDRAIGEAWERRFEQMASDLGWDCHRPNPPEAWWKPGSLPDRVVKRGVREWHELKHKRATRSGEYGLEQYRFEAFLRLARHVSEPVLYTIHDWHRAGARSRDDDVPNRLRDWITVDFSELEHSISRSEENGTTYYAGRSARTTILYWKTRLWGPLSRFWGVAGEPSEELSVPASHVHGYTGYDTDGFARCISDYKTGGPGCGDVLVRP